MSSLKYLFSRVSMWHCYVPYSDSRAWQTRAQNTGAAETNQGMISRSSRRRRHWTGANAFSSNNKSMCPLRITCKSCTTHSDERPERFFRVSRNFSYTPGKPRTRSRTWRINDNASASHSERDIFCDALMIMRYHTPSMRKFLGMRLRYLL